MTESFSPLIRPDLTSPSSPEYHLSQLVTSERNDIGSLYLIERVVLPIKDPAEFLRLQSEHPEIGDRIRRIVVMGGPGNGKSRIASQIAHAISRVSESTILTRITYMDTILRAHSRRGASLTGGGVYWNMTDQILWDRIENRPSLSNQPQIVELVGIGDAEQGRNIPLFEALAMLNDPYTFFLFIVGDPQLREHSKTAHDRSATSAPAKVITKFEAETFIAIHRWYSKGTPAEKAAKAAAVRHMQLPDEVIIRYERGEIKDSDVTRLRMEAAFCRAEFERMGVPSERGVVAFNLFNPSTT